MTIPTPDKSEMKAVTIPGDLYAFLMGEGEIDGTAFGDLNANLPGRFWWRALLRTAASSRPPADHVPDMVERVARAIYEALFDADNGVDDCGPLISKRHAAEAAIAALQALPSGEVVESAVRDCEGREMLEDTPMTQGEEKER